MLEFYSQVLGVHVAAVAASGSLFAARGLGTIAGQAWPAAPVVRWTGHAIDTVLLSAALMLVAMLPPAIFANGWLTTKLVLLVAYVACGSMALHRSRDRRGRSAWLALAIVLYASMLGIARMHHPLGWALLLPVLQP